MAPFDRLRWLRIVQTGPFLRIERSIEEGEIR